MFKQREYTEEWMDLPETSYADLNQALGDIQWVNQYLCGTAILADELFRKMDSVKTEFQTVLDIGTGSADIPVALAQKARKQGRHLQIVAVDKNPIAVEIARKHAASCPEIDVFECDAFAMPFPEQSFDWVITSMFMHHLSDEEAVALLKNMARIARHGFIVNDLQRHPNAYWGIKLVGFVMGKGRIFKNDAPLSVLKGFTFDELGSLCARSEIFSAQIKNRKPYRWLVTWDRANETGNHHLRR